jgi:hypothetical protein
MAFYWLVLITRALPNVVHEPNAFGVAFLLGLIISGGIAGYGGYLLLQRRTLTPLTMLMGLYTAGTFAYLDATFSHG